MTTVALVTDRKAYCPEEKHSRIFNQLVPGIDPKKVSIIQFSSLELFLPLFSITY